MAEGFIDSLKDAETFLSVYAYVEAYENGEAKNSLKRLDTSYISSIDFGVFSNYNLLSYINLPNCKYLGPEVFENCSNLKFVSLPSCTVIGIGAFSNCYNLEYFNNGSCYSNSYYQTSVASTAFYNCYNLYEIYISNAKYVGDSAFKNCSKIEFINLPVCTSIGSNAFENCILLDNISIPKVKYIYDNAFSNCVNLSIIYAPSVITVGQSAFYNCTSLETISVSYIISDLSIIFENCTNLKEIHMVGMSHFTSEIIGHGDFRVVFPAISILQPGNYYYQQYNIDHLVFPNLTYISSITSGTLYQNDNMFKNVKTIKADKLYSFGNNVFNSLPNMEYMDLPNLVEVPFTYLVNTDNYNFKYINAPKLLSVRNIDFIRCYGGSSIEYINLNGLTSLFNGYDSNINGIYLSLYACNIKNIYLNSLKNIDFLIYHTMGIIDNLYLNSVESITTSTKIGSKCICNARNIYLKNCSYIENISAGIFHTSDFDYSIMSEFYKNIYLDNCKFMSIGDTMNRIGNIYAPKIEFMSLRFSNIKMEEFSFPELQSGSLEFSINTKINKFYLPKFEGEEFIIRESSSVTSIYDIYIRGGSSMYVNLSNCWNLSNFVYTHSQLSYLYINYNFTPSGYSDKKLNINFPNLISCSNTIEIRMPTGKSVSFPKLEYCSYLYINGFDDIYIMSNAYIGQLSCINAKRITVNSDNASKRNFYFVGSELSYISLPNITYMPYISSPLITNLSLPKVTSINQILCYMNNLININLENLSSLPTGGWFSNLHKLININLNNCEYIGGESTFYGCTNLRTLSLPKCSYIGRSAFTFNYVNSEGNFVRGSNYLNTLYLGCSQVVSPTFMPNYGTLSSRPYLNLRVPKSMLDSYINDSRWQSYINNTSSYSIFITSY